MSYTLFNINEGHGKKWYQKKEFHLSDFLPQLCFKAANKWLFRILDDDTWPIRPANETYNAKVGGASSLQKPKKIPPTKKLLAFLSVSSQLLHRINTDNQTTLALVVNREASLNIQ